MFAQLLSRVFYMIDSNQASATGLSEKHPFVQFFREPDDLEHAVLLDDALFWGSLHKFRVASDAFISNLAKRLSDRRIMPMIDIWKLGDDVLATLPATRSMTAVERVQLLEGICVAVAEKLQKDCSIWTDRCYYDTYNRPIYKAKGVVGGDPQQINVCVGGEILDIASISPVVASAASFNIHRIYFDEDKAPDEETLKTAIKSLIVGELNDQGH